MDVEKIANSLKGYDVEVNYVDILSDSFYFEGKKCKLPKSSKNEAIAIRVTKKGKSGTCSSTNVNDWKKCLDTAKKICNLSKKAEYYGIPSKKPYKKVKMFDKKIMDLSLEEMKLMAVSMVNKSKVRVVDASVGRAIGHGKFANSNNIFYESKTAILSSSIDVKKGNSNAYETHSSRRLENFDWVGEKASEMCLKSLKKQKAKTGIYDIFMNYFASSSIFSILSNSFYANNIQQGNSKLINMIDQKIFSDKLNIIDDGLLPHGFLTSSIDSEGTPCQKKILVKNGTVKSYLYDFTTAKKEGKESTGNFKGIGLRPSVFETNFIVKPGKRNSKTILSGFNGVYVNSLVGTHTANPVSGDFSVNTDNAFLVKKGKMTPLKHVMLSGNVFEMLKNIKEISSDVRQENTIKCSPIIFSDVQVIA